MKLPKKTNPKPKLKRASLQTMGSALLGLAMLKCRDSKDKSVGTKPLAVPHQLNSGGLKDALLPPPPCSSTPAVCGADSELVLGMWWCINLCFLSQEKPQLKLCPALVLDLLRAAGAEGTVLDIPD